MGLLTRAGAIALIVTLWPVGVQADVAPPLGSGIHGLAGVNLGGAFHGGTKTGLVVGVEGSAAWFDPNRSLWWGGAYLDVLHDFGTGTWRSGVGPEFGWGPFGLDFGLAMTWEGGVHVGWQVRPLLTLGILTVYGRWERVAVEGNGFLELGVLIKAAVREPARRQYHRHVPPPPELPEPGTPVGE
jgi:hypothetical protein